MNTVNLIALLAAIVFLVQVIYLTSKNKLQDQQAFLWLVLSIAGVIIAIFLPKLNKISHAIGISYMPSFIFMAAFLVLLSITMYQTIIISKHQEKLKRLSQDIGFLSKEMDEFKKGLGDQK